MYFCEKCGKEVFEKFGSGRFCSRQCANSRNHSEETKQKISDSIKKNLSEFCISGKVYPKDICPICNSMIDIRSLKKHINRHNQNVVLRGSNRNIKLDITNIELYNYRASHQYCEICGKSLETIINNSKFDNLCIDHDHSTNKFRGLLCSVCNRQLGWYENNKENIIKYLSK